MQGGPKLLSVGLRAGASGQMGKHGIRANCVAPTILMERNLRALPYDMKVTLAKSRPVTRSVRSRTWPLSPARW